MEEAEGLEMPVFATAVTEGRVGSRTYHFDSEIDFVSRSLLVCPWTVYKLVFCRSLSNKASQHSTLCFVLSIEMEGEKSI
jgi:hypothetical protein